MVERDFVDSLMATINKRFEHSAMIRSSDSYTLGIPDVLAWMPIDNLPGRPWSVAIEAKSLQPLMEDPLHRGRRTGLMLKHPFTGPQISLLRAMARAGVDAFGLVRASADAAFRIHPDNLPAKTGNFTHEELLAAGRLIRREHGLWQFWEGE